MATTRTMQQTFRGKHAFDNCHTKEDLIKTCDLYKNLFEKLPEETHIENSNEDYIFFSVEAKDKDDVKYYKRKGFN
tara:strand:- start:1 stop:228 length:228 start_codon:yes stop_codon:yes gene_type:complete